MSASSQDVRIKSTGTLAGSFSMRRTDNGCGAAADIDCTSTDIPIACCQSLNTTYGPDAVRRGDRTILSFGDWSSFSLQTAGGVSVAPGLASPGVPTAGGGVFAGAKQLRFNLVPSYDKCTHPTETHAPPTALAACAPAITTASDPGDAFSFGPQGKGTGTMEVRPDGLSVALKLSGVEKGGALYTGDDLAFTTTVRLTARDCGQTPVLCTLFDFSYFAWLDCQSGRCSAHTKDTRWKIPMPAILQLVSSPAIYGKYGGYDPVVSSGLFVK